MFLDWRETSTEESPPAFCRKTNRQVKKSGKSDEKSRRQRERFELALPVRVQCRESQDQEWLEMSRLVDVTPFGARLRLKRPTEIGRLLLLTLPMPRPLRCFDHVEEQYRVWSLVRNIRLLDPALKKGALVEIGVAFVGKRPPASLAIDPSRRYEIAHSVSETGLWTVQEEFGASIAEMPISEKRRDTRHNIPVEVLIEVFDHEGTLSQSESTVTENIGRQGAAVFSTLDISAGRFVKISSLQYQSVLLAAVRSRHVAADGIVRLHLEFIGSEWPL
ncbi:MAG: hypothetical protein QOK48_234 [Blastocatellia bacterium]|jgi:hypothetical protein|nr:hypothetical protein [Blastocatellia bacterium]